MEKLPPFDKYDHYLRAVQDPKGTCDFLSGIYQDMNGKEPLALREDFAGTFSLCYEWVVLTPKHKATAIDKDEAPLNYGKKRFLHQLTTDEKKRLKIVKGDVRKARADKADVICALNFSYGVFKEREVLKDYLKKCRASLKPRGVMVLDTLGGMEVSSALETTAECEGFTYTWEQVKFDPLTRDAKFAIHFQRPGDKPKRNQFVYDWRMWTPVELRDLLTEVGFKDTYVYCETDDGSPAWVAYVVGVK